jgi:hypothetical protein
MPATAFGAIWALIVGGTVVRTILVRVFGVGGGHIQD